MQGESLHNDKKSLNEGTRRLSTEDTDVPCSFHTLDATSLSDTDDDSSDSDADVNNVVDAFVAHIRAPESEKPARRRPWCGFRTPSVPDSAGHVEPFAHRQSKETQVTCAQHSSCEGGLTDAMQTREDTRRLLSSKFCSAPPGPGAREQLSRNILDNPNDEVSGPMPLHSLAKADDKVVRVPNAGTSQSRLSAHQIASNSVHVPNAEATQVRLRVHRFMSSSRCAANCESSSRRLCVQSCVSAPCKSLLEESKLPMLGSETLECEASSVDRKCPPCRCYKSDNDVAKQKWTDLHQDRPSRHGGRSCSPCLVFSQRVSTKVSGMQYNIVRFNATTTLSTSRDSTNRSCSARAQRTKMEIPDERVKVVAKTRLPVEPAVPRNMVDLFRGMSRREVREMLKDDYSPEEVASVLEALRLRTPRTGKRRRSRH